MREVVAEFRPAIAQRDQKIVMQLRTCANALRAECDPVLIRRLLVNLISNASKFSPCGSLITVSASLDGNSVLLQVADQGSGFSITDAAHVFDEHYRGRNAEGVEGAGIGLSSVRDIVSSHNGTIELEPIPGHGALVSVSLPKTQSI